MTIFTIRTVQKYKESTAYAPHICGWTATHTSHVDQKNGSWVYGYGCRRD